jgi:protein involved in sex pheromone biosynthesis
MKKLLSLAMLAAVVALVGCEKSNEDKAKAAAGDAQKSAADAVKGAADAAKGAADATKDALKK